MHVLTKYRETIDMQAPDEVIWGPYPEAVIMDLPAYCSSGRAIWRTRAPLIFFCVVEMYNPDRVMRQFGFRQMIPPLQSTNMQLHKIDLRGRRIRIGAPEHSAYVCMWNERASNIATDESLEEPMDFYNPYMLWYRRITRRFMSPRGAIAEALAHGITSIHQLTLGDDVSIARIRDVAASTLTAVHADYRMHNMPSSFQASHHSSHADTPSRHDTPSYTPSVPLNEFGTPHTPSVPPNITFEAMEAFPFNRAPTSSRHFHASPIMMNLSGSTSTHNGGMRDNDDIQRKDAQNPADVGHSDIPLALNRNVRVVKRTRCGTGSHYLGQTMTFSKLL
ncbi:hypothetical protein Scep_009748 [Stephania cephalantha]|uniref:Aminotransferase-like plant mobile domain-containing protein n=1 Tax=Stephania cephalantha TaxID=152367 RepID=A0AAP0JTU0_9MAGN